MARKQAPKLTTYRGEEPDGYRLNFAGSAENLGHDLGDGEEVVLIVRGKIKNPSFKTNQFGVRRLHESVRIDYAQVADPETADAIFSRIKAEEDAAAGQTSMDGELGDPDNDLPEEDARG